MAPWVRDPHSGGVNIPPALRKETEQRLRAYAQKKYAGTYTTLGIRFRGPFCYVDAFKEPDPHEKPPAGFGESLEEYRQRLRETPTHLCRLRYCGRNEWSVAFYTYSHETYEPCVFQSGKFYGTPEEGFDVGAVYL